MLLNDFYNCVELTKNDHELSASIVFNADHDIFKGHFPNQPVLPGVCMMEIIKEILQQEINKSLILVSAGNVKFLNLVIPTTRPVLNIRWKQDADLYNVNASLKTDNSYHFKIDGKYKLL